jgi:hypothetical protein
LRTAWEKSKISPKMSEKCKVQNSKLAKGGMLTFAF